MRHLLLILFVTFLTYLPPLHASSQPDSPLLSDEEGIDGATTTSPPLTPAQDPLNGQALRDALLPLENRSAASVNTPPWPGTPRPSTSRPGSPVAAAVPLSPLGGATDSPPPGYRTTAQSPVTTSPLDTMNADEPAAAPLPWRPQPAQAPPTYNAIQRDVFYEATMRYIGLDPHNPLIGTGMRILSGTCTIVSAVLAAPLVTSELTLSATLIRGTTALTFAAASYGFYRLANWIGGYQAPRTPQSPLAG